jgi:hypothetical protein
LQPPGETTQAHDEPTAVELLNKFATSTVEEPRESVELQPAGAVPEETVMVEIVEEREEQEAEHLGHLYFKTHCLLSDLHSLREFIVKAWSEYADCEIDLMTASIVTDSAMKFGEELVEEVVADWQNSWAYPSEDLPAIIYNIAIHSRGMAGSAAPAIELAPRTMKLWQVWLSSAFCPLLFC